MHVLGISAFYHDSAACLLRDGEIVAAAEEERFTRRKHDSRFPRHAVAYCLREGGLRISDLDLVVFYEQPLRKLARVCRTYLATAPRGFTQFRRSVVRWLVPGRRIRRALNRGLGQSYRGAYRFTTHHEAHAGSAFYPSPFARAAIVTLDGVGESTTSSIARGDGHRIELLRELRFPHSLGLLYSALTAFTGFRVNSGEYKIMGLAPYGEPVYRETILRELVHLESDGSFRLNMRYFAFDRSDVMYTAAFARLFDGPARREVEPITQREMNLAASIQSVTEEIVLRIARTARAVTGCTDLVLAGGVALNCVANGRLLREGTFERIWVQPAAGDAGGALGCALFAWHHLLGYPREAGEDRMRGSFLGPCFTRGEVRRQLAASGAVFHTAPDEATLCVRIAELIAKGQVVGHFAGRMEFGPRALGNRSILADPRSRDMQSVLNLKIKFRESFRPFAPAILRDKVQDYFEWPAGMDSPYMSFVTHLYSDRRGQPADRPTVPAITHVDHSARIQTIDAERHPRLYGILRAFEALTGCPLVINTSLNVRGEPIVHTPAQAFHCLMSTGMDALVLEDVWLLKHEQPVANARIACVEAD